MITNTRNFLRSFTSFKAKARKGEAVRVQDKEGEFLFTAAAARKSLIGAAKGKIVFHGDLTKPTLPDESWKPSL
jgi:streptomycin 6-kinase